MPTLTERVAVWIMVDDLRAVQTIYEWADLTSDAPLDGRTSSSSGTLS